MGIYEIYGGAMGIDMGFTGFTGIGMEYFGVLWGIC